MTDANDRGRAAVDTTSTTADLSALAKQADDLATAHAATAAKAADEAAYWAGVRDAAAAEVAERIDN